MEQKNELLEGRVGSTLFKFAAPFMLASFVFCTNSYFSAYGKAIISFVHSMIATFCVRIPATYFLSRYVTDSLFSMGFAAPAASLVSIIICVFVLQRLHRGVVFYDK